MTAEQVLRKVLTVLNLLSKPLHSPGAQCVGHLEDHSDMTEEEVLKALAEHEREVAPVLRYYKARLGLMVLLRC